MQDQCLFPNFHLKTNTLTENTVYIKLLDEGTDVWRPVSAVKLAADTYELQGHDIYDPEDEVWEFLPGSQVIVNKVKKDGEIILVAITKL